MLSASPKLKPVTHPDSRPCLISNIASLATKSLLNHYQFDSDCETGEGQAGDFSESGLLAKYYLFDSTMKVISGPERRTNVYPES